MGSSSSLNAEARDRAKSSERGAQKKTTARPPKRSRILATAAIALIAAGASFWMTRPAEVHCDSLAPLTVLATLAAFLISICFRQMGRYPDRASRLFLLTCMLIAAATLFADFRFVRRYRNFCDTLQQQMRQSAPSR